MIRALSFDAASGELLAGDAELVALRQSRQPVLRVGVRHDGGLYRGRFPQADSDHEGSRGSNGDMFAPELPGGHLRHEGR